VTDQRPLTKSQSDLLARLVIRGPSFDEFVDHRVIHALANRELVEPFQSRPHNTLTWHPTPKGRKLVESVATEGRRHWWLTTEPNPRSAATGHDAGQRGWRLHAVHTDATTFKAVRYTAALCGLQPAHGWGLDMFIEDKCKRCAAIMRRAQGVSARE